MPVVPPIAAGIPAGQPRALIDADFDLLGFLGRAPLLEANPRDKVALQIAALFANRLPESERAQLEKPVTAEAFLRALAKGEA